MQNLNIEDANILDQIFLESTSFMTLVSIPDLRYLKSNNVHCDLMQNWDLIGKTVMEVEPEFKAQGFVNLLRDVAKTGMPYVGRETPVKYKANTPDEKIVYLDFTYQPLKNSIGEVYAIFAHGYDVSEKVLSRKSVENERQNFRLLFKQTPEMVCILKGPDHVFEFVNEAHVRALGFDATGMAVRHAQPESVEIHGLLDEVYRTGITEELKEIAVTVTDRLRYFNLTYSARFDEKGSVNGVMILGVEITDTVLARKQNLEMLEMTRQNENQLKDILNTIPQIVWISGTDGKPVWYNSKWYDYTGIPVGEMSDESKFLDPKQLDNIYKKQTHSLKTGERVEIEMSLKGRDGLFRWFLVRMEPNRDASGKIVRWIGTSTDIHETRKAALSNEVLALTASLFAQPLEVEVRLKTLANLIVNTMATWCSIALVTESSPEPVQMAAAHPDPEHLKQVLDLFSEYPTDWDAPTGGPNVLRTGVSEIYPHIPQELLQKSAKDEKHLKLIMDLQMNSAMIVPLKLGTKVLGVITFISSDPTVVYGQRDLDLAEELGRRAAVAVENSILFEETQKAIRARDVFLSIASHELKTPLTSLKLQSQMRRRALEKGNLSFFSPEGVTKMVKDDERQVNRLAKLVDDMLDISRINTGKFKLELAPTNISEVVRDVLERFHYQLQELSIDVDFKGEKEIVGTWDRYLIEQIFTNLLTNAMKYGEHKPISVSLESQDDCVFMKVRDQGIGFENKDSERIFKQYERLNSVSAVSGLGLGLYIVRQLVEAHQGKINVESGLGKGSVFTVILPKTLATDSESQGFSG